jgi:hypothetical protein
MAMRSSGRALVTGIEALDSLTSGRVQTVKHVHVNEGGQAIVADEFHQHRGAIDSDGVEALGKPGVASHSEQPQRLRNPT